MFYGRADAHYCCGACRQKAHRARTGLGGAAERVPPLGLPATVAHAQETRKMARAARARAQAARSASAAALAKSRRALTD